MDVPTQNTSNSANNPLKVMQKGETEISEIRRHPAGLLGLYLGVGAFLIVLAVMAFIFVPSSTGNSAIRVLCGLAFFVMLILSMAFVFVSTKIYFGNYWVLTSDSVTQVVQQALFRKQSAQLSLKNLEDISAEKNSFLATSLNYGDLRVETAGEREKFVLSYCPNPTKYAQQIIDARETFEQKINQAGEDAPPTQAKSIGSTVEQLGQAALADFPDQRG